VADELKHQNDALDEALRESFPASDPIAVSITTVPDAALATGSAHPDVASAAARKE